MKANHYRNCTLPGDDRLRLVCRRRMIRQGESFVMPVSLWSSYLYGLLSTWECVSLFIREEDGMPRSCPGFLLAFCHEAQPAKIEDTAFTRC